MCGIIGVASTNPVKRKDLLVGQRDTMTHRGPDDAGLWWSDDGRVGLAHRRLSIIDLSPAGHQPMTDVAGLVCITFNGEIYNFKEVRRNLESRGHTFVSATDTEVIIEAYNEWGIDCLSRLNGMFAFGLFDTKKRRLFLARDRAGEKPLFYRLAGSVLTFASELKALMRDPDFPRVLNPVGLRQYLANGFLSGGECILRGVSKLPPAHALTFDLGTGAIRTWRYWELPEPLSPSDQETDPEDLAAELEYLLADAVHRQLVADVPVGILLSGGIDSSLVTSLAVRDSRKIRTFTVTFPGYGGYDESPHARLVAQAFGTEHVELTAETSSFDLLPLLASQLDEPLADSSIIPTYLVTRLVRQYCTVALGGDGGDELFAGYDSYSRLAWFNKYLSWVPGHVLHSLSRSAASFLPVGFRGRNFLIGLDCALSEGKHGAPALFDPKATRKILSSEVARSIEQTSDPMAARCHEKSGGYDPVQLSTRNDFLTYLPDDILTKVDRASMLNSLEVRAPFLDQRVLEFAFSRLPGSLKATATKKKILPKMLGRRLLPSDFVMERKHGFSIPLAHWLRNQWKEPMRALLLDTDGTLFHTRVIDDLWQGHQQGRSNSERLFAIALFELWRSHYGVGI